MTTASADEFDSLAANFTGDKIRASQSYLPENIPAS
jgi:hypothetical protein